MMMMMIMHVTLTGSVLVIVAEVCVNSATELQDIVPLVLVHDFILRLLWNTYMEKKTHLNNCSPTIKPLNNISSSLL